MRQRTTPLALLALLLAGCGGSSHHSSGSDVNSGTDTNARVGPQVTIAWPARARDFSAPSTAAFAVVTVPGGGVNGADAAATVVRPDGTAAVSKTYTVPIAVQPGLRLLRVDFYATTPVASGLGASPPSLATTTVNVKVLNDGTLQTLDGKTLGTVGFASNVASIALATGQTIETGVASDLGVTATTTTGGVAALAPGTVTFQVTDGTAFLKANADGSFTGLAAGTATVVPTADGVAGKPVTVTVLPAPVASRSVAIANSDIAIDTTRNVVWAALPPTGTNGNSVVSVNSSSGALGTPIAVGSDPSVLAISDDETRLYVGLRGTFQIRPINLTTNTAGAAFSVPQNNNGSGYAADIAVQPGDAGTISVIGVIPSYGGTYGPAILDDGVPRLVQGGYSTGQQLLWGSASALYAYTDSSYGSVYVYSVDAQGATQTNFRSTITNSILRLSRVGDRIYNSNGAIFDADTLSQVGSFPLASGDDVSPQFYAPAVDLATKRAYFLEIASGVTRLHIFNTDSLLEISSRRISGLTSPSDNLYTLVPRLSLVGTDRLAFRLNDQIVFLDNVSTL